MTDQKSRCHSFPGLLFFRNDEKGHLRRDALSLKIGNTAQVAVFNSLFP